MRSEYDQLVDEAVALAKTEEGLPNPNSSILKRAAIYRRMITANPNNTYPHIQLGMALWAIGKQNEARASFREAVRCFGGPAKIPPMFRAALISRGLDAELLVAEPQNIEPVGQPWWRFWA